MRNLRYLIISLALAACGPQVAPISSTGAPASGEPPSARHRADFAARLDAQLRREEEGNLVYSPASVEGALRLVREGATGETATEIDGVLGTGRDREGAIGSGPELVVVNRLYADEKTRIVPAFASIMRDTFGAAMELVDFRGDPAAARAEINRWVRDQTMGRIDALVPEDGVDENTRIALVNAVTLSATWATPFAPGKTTPMDFRVDGGELKQVATMHTRASANHGTYAGARTIDLPYRTAAGNSRLAMLIAVPDTVALSAIEAAYAHEGLGGLLAATSTPAQIDVALPRFEIGSDLDLPEALQEMGIKRAFDDEAAQFDAMTPDLVSISKVFHQARIEVDEAGTQATAATAVLFEGESAAGVGMEVVDFTVDRSFAFFIHDERGTVLFAGRVLDPAGS